MTDWLAAASRAKTPEARRNFLRLLKREQLEAEIAACRSCPLNRSRSHTVPMSGFIPTPLACVGEAPGQEEDRQGKPFVGRSGKLLDKTLTDAGMERKKVAVFNTLACRPPKNRTPSPEESSACRPFFDRQLELSGAWVVLLLGGSALNQIQPGAKISRARGTPFWQGGRIWIPTYHPAYILRNPKAGVHLKQDIRLGVDIALGRKWWPPVSTQGLRFADDFGPAFTSAIDTQGWADVYSRRLQDEVMVVKTDETTVPINYLNLPRYTVEELVRIGEAGKGQKMTVGDLRRIHLVKQYLGGKVVV